MSLDQRIKDVMASDEFRNLCKHVKPNTDNFRKILQAMLSKDYPKLSQDALDAVMPPMTRREELQQRLHRRIGQFKEKRSTKKNQEELFKERAEMLSKFAQQSKLTQKSDKNRKKRLRKRYGIITEDAYLESLKYLQQNDESNIDLSNRHRNIVELYQEQQSVQHEEELVLSD